MHRFSRFGHQGHSFMCHLSVSSEPELEKLCICPKVIQLLNYFGANAPFFQIWAPGTFIYVSPVSIPWARTGKTVHLPQSNTTPPVKSFIIWAIECIILSHYGVLLSYDLTTFLILQQVKFFHCFFVRKFKTSKRHSEINWPLGGTTQLRPVAQDPSKPYSPPQVSFSPFATVYRLDSKTLATL